jgi:alpha-beta hydrolase superfamily lysophospholipase
LPIIVFGHSFGSFLVQEYIIRYGSEISGAVICGSAARTGPEIAMGKAVAYIQKGIFGERRKAKFIEALTFGSYNRRIKDSKSKVAWVSSDAEEVRKYEEDPLCGTIFTAGFYYYLFKAFSKLYKKERLSKIPQHLPILIIAGEEDPVGGYGKLVKKLYKIYKANRINDLQLKLYSGGRHEILNEVNRDEIFSDVLEWLEKVK